MVLGECVSEIPACAAYLGGCDHLLRAVRQQRESFLDHKSHHAIRVKDKVLTRDIRGPDGGHQCPLLAVQPQNAHLRRL